MHGRESVQLFVLIGLEHHVHLVGRGGDWEGNLVATEATQNRTGLGFAIIDGHIIIGAFLNMKNVIREMATKYIFEFLAPDAFLR